MTFALAITHQKHLAQSGRSVGAVRGVQWTFSIHSAYLLKSQSENKKFSWSVWITCKLRIRHWNTSLLIVQKIHWEKVYFRTQILEHPSIGEYWNVFVVPVLLENVISMFIRTCWSYPEAHNTGSQMWSSIVQNSCPSIWDFKITFPYTARCPKPIFDRVEHFFWDIGLKLWCRTSCTWTIWSWTINNLQLEEYSKSNILQEHYLNAHCSRSIFATSS